MTSRRAILLPGARADLLAIIDWIATESHSRQVGYRFGAQLRNRCHELAALSIRLGRERDDLSPGLRSTPWRDYLIFFRYVDDRFEVVRILHAARDIARQFPPTPES